MTVDLPIPRNILLNLTCLRGFWCKGDAYRGNCFFCRGSEPPAEEAVRLICETGGVAVLAHPWSLKNPFPIIRKLKDAGLHGIEVYRSDGKVAGTIYYYYLYLFFLCCPFN